MSDFLHRIAAKNRGLAAAAARDALTRRSRFF
jgi:hypothetical protein